MDNHTFHQAAVKRARTCSSLSIAISLLIAPLQSASAAIEFEDATSSAGFTYMGRSWGAAWGDYDGDGIPDLWVNNHFSPPELFRNPGSGTFENVTEQLVPPEVLQELDMHGSAWADFDNDGDLDLIQMVGADSGATGSTGDKLLLVNDSGSFTGRAREFGLHFPEGRSRMPLWLDADNDGLLDVYMSARGQGSAEATAGLFRQTESGFEDITEESGVTPESPHGTNYAMLGDITGDNGLELLLDDNHEFPMKILQPGSFPMQDILTDLEPFPTTKKAQDAVIADLTGNLKNDIYIVTGPRNSEVVLARPDSIEGHFGGKQNSERGVRFKTAGEATFDFRWLNRNQWNLGDIYIGSGGYNPTHNMPALSSEDEQNHGIASHQAGTTKGIYVGYDADAKEWVFLASTPNQIVDFVINTQEPVTDMQTVGLDQGNNVSPDYYYVNTGSGFANETTQRGIPEPSEGRSIVAGDFDNDMDLDLYIVSTGPTQNHPNILYENQGDGSFVKVPDAGGAGGTIDGRGDAVAVADYDMDGFLDLFVTNGKSRRPFEEDGPVQLFRNKGNANHWLQLDLRGVKSNRDGIGARIELTTGGKTQLREQNAGIHSRAQNHMRVHFGLGENPQADRIVIHWPSGITQELTDIRGNQVLEVVEPAEAATNQPSGTAGGASQPPAAGCHLEQGGRSTRDPALPILVLLASLALWLRRSGSLP